MLQLRQKTLILCMLLLGKESVKHGILMGMEIVRVFTKV